MFVVIVVVFAGYWVLYAKLTNLLDSLMQQEESAVSCQVLDTSNHQQILRSMLVTMMEQHLCSIGPSVGLI